MGKERVFFIIYFASGRVNELSKASIFDDRGKCQASRCYEAASCWQAACETDGGEDAFGDTRHLLYSMGPCGRRYHQID